MLGLTVRQYRRARGRDPGTHLRAVGADGRCSSGLSETSRGVRLLDEDLRAAIEGLPPTARDLLRRVLIGDQADRDTAAMALLRYRDAAGDELADIIDMLSINPEARRKVVRMLAEVDAVEL